MSSNAIGWMLDPLGMVTKGKVKGLIGIMGIVPKETYGNKVEEVSEPTSTAADDLAAAQKASAELAELANDKRKAAIARSRTIYTNPLGLSTEANIARKTLTGQ